jgi:3',5'-cyclic AMP phosphodiesterase CpdA
LIKNENKYTVEICPVSLFFIDSGPNYILEPWDWARVLGAGLYDKDMKWLEEKFSQSTYSKKIVFMHHPAVNDRDKFGVMVDCIARNRKEFINLCNDNNVDLVLTGHTHRSIIYDGEENIYQELPLSCEGKPTLFVQTDDCKQGVHYRNITVTCDDIIIHETVEIDFEPTTRIRNRISPQPLLFSLLSNIFKELLSILQK